LRAGRRPGGSLAQPEKNERIRSLSLRYAHADAYVRERAAQAGLRVRSDEALMLRRESGKDVAGRLWVLEPAR
jgi:predicted TPR repeat methyltransferase